jgi:predicted phage terminase large subunit-like protein
MASRNFPAWYLARFPNRRVLLTAYEAEFAASWGGRARAILEEFGQPVFGVGVEGRQKARNSWRVSNGSEMVTAGVGGSLTGRGADVLIIDDPVKNETQAFSQTFRDRTWDWYQSTAYTRLEPGGAIILIMTRWHEDDLAGRILATAENSGEPWRVLSFPAIAEDHDVLGRQPGEALWPDRYGLEALAQIQEAVGSYWWSALYQQRPSLPEGNLFRREWWRFWRELPDFEEAIQSWDATFSETSDGSYVVGQVWGKLGRDRYLVDQMRGRWSFTQTLDAIRELSRRWPKARIRLVENKANGPAIMSTLQREIGGFVAIEPSGSKEARASSVTPEVEGGNVFLPDPTIPGHEWVRDFISEWATFPRGPNDDQVDAGTQALRRWAGSTRISSGWIAR